MVADERAVGLARLGDRRAFSRARHEAAARALAREIGAAQHGGLDASLPQEPSDHADDGALAARARDGDTRRSGVDHLGEQLRPRKTIGAERTRRAQLGRVDLDGRRVDEAIDRGRDGRPVLPGQLDAQPAERRRDLLLLAQIERAVGTLNRVAARPHQARERPMPAPAMPEK